MYGVPILICSGVVSTIALLFFIVYLICRWRNRWNSFKSLVLHGPHNRRAEKVSFFGVEYVFISYIIKPTISYLACLVSKGGQYR